MKLNYISRCLERKAETQGTKFGFTILFQRTHNSVTWAR